MSELSYLTQIVLMQYEDPMADPHSDRRFQIELYFSPGLKTPDHLLNSSNCRRMKKDKSARLMQVKSKTEEDFELKRDKDSKC